MLKNYISGTPAETIRESKAKLKDDIREATNRYIENTGAKLTSITVGFIETTAIGMAPSSMVRYVSVEEEI